MRKLLFLLALLVSGLVYAADKGTWTGYISDADCGTKGNNADHAECAKKCVKGGAAPVLVVGDKVYAISNPKLLRQKMRKQAGAIYAQSDQSKSLSAQDSSSQPRQAARRGSTTTRA